VKRVRECGARAGRVAGEREQGRSQHGEWCNVRLAPDTQHQRNAFGDNAGQYPPAVFDWEQTESARKSRCEGDLHRWIRPGDARRDPAEAPDDEGPETAEQAEVLEPVERG
jgi:hypothetical protein